MKLKVGDKVKLVSGYEDAKSNPIWGGKYGYVSGIIYEIDYGVYVNWDNGKTNVYSSVNLTIIEEFKPLDDLMKFIEEELTI